MRRLFVGGAITVALCLAFPAVAIAGTGPKATGSIGSPGNAAYQAGGTAEPFTLAFTAQGTGTGTKGNFTFTRADGQWFTVANVNCLHVVGNEAGFSGVVTGSSNADGTGLVPQVGQTGYAAVQDNGQGSSQTGPDFVQIDAGPQYTGSCAPSSLVYQVTSGTIQVTS